MGTQVASPRWSRRADARPSELLAAAQDLFTSKGVAATTVEEITSAAGVAKGSFYRYFDSKEAVLAALKTRFFDDMIAGSAAAVGDLRDATRLELLEVRLTSAITYLFEHADLLAVWNHVVDADLAYRDTTRGLLGLASLYEAVIVEGVAAGEFDCADPARAALLIVYGVQGAATAAALGAAVATAADVTAAAIELNRRALGVPGT